MEYPTRNHPSSFHQQTIVYPVISRRSRGISIGINVSPTKRCTFGCVYCQIHVDRTKNAKELALLSPTIDLGQLRRELLATVDSAVSGRLFEEERFGATRSDYRRLNDFAFSGDGEPTLAPQFPEVVDILRSIRRELALPQVKLILITNSTTLREERTIAGCDALTAENGEIWAKLDGGTEADYREMNRSEVPFSTILENLRFASRRWPVKLQTMLLRLGGRAPDNRWIDCYCAAVREILGAGGTFRSIQLYTVARPPAHSCCTPLDDGEMDAYAAKIAEETSLPTEVFYSK
ncbi:MAG: radical SAM protein [Thermoguttaceae bacterium]|nr:radical SAM protein [Thermoguttaceae bacterium]